jgi:uncharacterized protein with HEPN domain
VGKDIFGEDFKKGFTGIVFMVQAGQGTIKVNAESVGNMTLKVKIGSNAPMTFELEGKMKASIPYSVTKPTYVYIYGGETSTANAGGLRAASSDNALKIYGIEWSSEVTSIESIHRGVETNAVIYNIMILGEAANMLTYEFRDAHPETQWRQVTNMRNFLIHGYHNVEEDLVWEAITQDLKPLREQIEKYLTDTDWEQWEQK